MNPVIGTRVSARLLSLFALTMLTACAQEYDDDGSLAEISDQVSHEAPSGKNSDKTLLPEVVLAPTFGTVHQGVATYYRATGEGNCSFEASDNLMVAAVNTTDYAKALLCGGFLKVEGPNGSVTVRVVDRCPGCKQDNIDLSRQAFEKIASLSKGRVPITWQVVSGTIAGPVEYHYMDGTSRYWTAIQIRNHRWPIAGLAIKPKGTTEWIPVERRLYNYFVYPKPIASGKVQVRLTAVTGAVLEDELPEPTGGLLVKGGAQF